MSPFVNNGRHVPVCYIHLANLIVDDFEELSLLTDSNSLEVLSLGLKLEDDLFFQRKLLPEISRLLWQQFDVVRSDSGISSTLQQNEINFFMTDSFEFFACTGGPGYPRSFLSANLLIHI
jgi:hypothetical protein